jgi:predicted anti-sigma-YlaC factor YlaD
MKCKDAKTQAALLIGNDLEPTALEEVRKHLGQCPGCREHFERLSSCLEVLQGPAQSWNGESESLWPKLSARLASPNVGQKPHRLNGWAPTLAVAAACTAMFWVASSQWSADQSVGQPAGVNRIPLQPVGESPALEKNDNSPSQREIELQRRRALQDPSGQESGMMHRSTSAIPVVPVSEPTH